MTDLSYMDLKSKITSALNISSSNLDELKTAFSKLYIHFQTEAVKQITVTPLPNTCFNWIKGPSSDKNKILLFFHGGGFTMGNTQDHLELIAQLILKTNVTVLSVDYRTYPQYIFPTALEDVKSAYVQLLENGFSPQQIAFSGISAGGLLVTQLILECQLQNLPQPKTALVMSGPANFDFNKPSCYYNADRDWITAKRLQTIKKLYVPNEKKFKKLLSPLDNKYSSYPITLFQAGDYELLLDDSIYSYEKLREANYPVYLNIVSELPHCWQFFASVYEPGRVAIEEAAKFLNKYF